MNHPRHRHILSPPNTDSNNQKPSTSHEARPIPLLDELFAGPSSTSFTLTPIPPKSIRQTHIPKRSINAAASRIKDIAGDASSLFSGNAFESGGGVGDNTNEGGSFESWLFPTSSSPPKSSVFYTSNGSVGQVTNSNISYTTGPLITQSSTTAVVDSSITDNGSDHIYNSINENSTLPIYSYQEDHLNAVVSAFDLPSTASNQYQQPAQPHQEQYQQPGQAHQEQYQQPFQTHQEQYQQPAQPHQEQYQQPGQAHQEQYQQPFQTHQEQYQQPAQPHQEQYHSERQYDHPNDNNTSSNQLAYQPDYSDTYSQLSNQTYADQRQYQQSQPQEHYEMHLQSSYMQQPYSNGYYIQAEQSSLQYHGDYPTQQNDNQVAFQQGLDQHTSDFRSDYKYDSHPDSAENSPNMYMDTNHYQQNTTALPVTDIAEIPLSLTDEDRQEAIMQSYIKENENLTRNNGTTAGHTCPADQLPPSSSPYNLPPFDSNVKDEGIQKGHIEAMHMEDPSADRLLRHRGHCVAVFGFGRLIISTVQRQQRIVAGHNGMQSVEKAYTGPLKFIPVYQLVSSLDVIAAPMKTETLYPLMSNRSSKKKKEVLKMCDELVTEAESREQDLFKNGSSSFEYQEAVAEVVLWKLLKHLVGNNGVLISSNEKPEQSQAVVDLLARLPELPASSSAALDEIYSLLLQGDRIAASKVAIGNSLWAHALIISSHIRKDYYTNVVMEFARHEFGDPCRNDLRALTSGIVGGKGEDRPALRVLYSIFAGAGRHAVSEFLPPFVELDASHQATATETLSRWQDTLAMILANRTPGDSVVLADLGERLLEYGRPKAAHICFLVSGISTIFGNADSPKTRAGLIGNSYPCQNGRVVHNTIKMMELYEYALSFANTNVSTPLPHFQAYKLAYATYLAELGRFDDARRYLDSVKTLVESYSKGSPYFDKVFGSVIADLGVRIEFELSKSGSGTINSSTDGGGWLSRVSSWNSIMTAMDRGLNKFMNGAVGLEGDDVTKRTSSMASGLVVGPETSSAISASAPMGRANSPSKAPTKESSAYAGFFGSTATPPPNSNRSSSTPTMPRNVASVISSDNSVAVGLAALETIAHSNMQHDYLPSSTSSASVLNITGVWPQDNTSSIDRLEASTNVNSGTMINVSVYQSNGTYNNLFYEQPVNNTYSVNEGGVSAPIDDQQLRFMAPIDNQSMQHHFLSTGTSQSVQGTHRPLDAPVDSQQNYASTFDDSLVDRTLEEEPLSADQRQGRNEQADYFYDNKNWNSTNSTQGANGLPQDYLSPYNKDHGQNWHDKRLLSSDAQNQQSSWQISPDNVHTEDTSSTWLAEAVNGSQWQQEQLDITASSSIEESLLAGATSTIATTLFNKDSNAEDDLEDLGFGNSSLKVGSKNNGVPVRPASPAGVRPDNLASTADWPVGETFEEKKAEEPNKNEITRSSYIGIVSGFLFGSRQAAGAASGNKTNGPVKANLGEDNSFVYDPVQKRWINKKAGLGTDVASNAIAPPLKRAASTPPVSGTPSTSSDGSTLPPLAPPPSAISTPLSTAPSSRPASPAVQSLKNMESSSAPGTPSQFAAALGRSRSSAGRRGRQVHYDVQPSGSAQDRSNGSEPRALATVEVRKPSFGLPPPTIADANARMMSISVPVISSSAFGETNESHNDSRERHISANGGDGDTKATSPIVLAPTPTQPLSTTATASVSSTKSMAYDKSSFSQLNASKPLTTVASTKSNLDRPTSSPLSATIPTAQPLLRPPSATPSSLPSFQRSLSSSSSGLVSQATFSTFSKSYGSTGDGIKSSSQTSLLHHNSNFWKEEADTCADQGPPPDDF